MYNLISMYGLWHSVLNKSPFVPRVCRYPMRMKDIKFGKAGWEDGLFPSLLFAHAVLLRNLPFMT